MLRRIIHWVLRRIRGHGLGDLPGASFFIRAFRQPSAVIHGFPIELDREDSLRLSLFGSFEPEETALVESVIKPGDVVIDIGAHIGYYTLLFSKLVGTSGHVFAFEPAPDSCDLLRRNVSTNGLNNVTIVNAAVGDNPGTGILYLGSTALDNRTASRTGGAAIPINVLSLDAYFCDNEKVDFVKMDIQGAEPLALRGMEATLARSPNARILTEFWPDGLRRAGGDPEMFLSHLRSLGFTFAKTLPGTAGGVYFYCIKERRGG
jgi:FkbM family methyltransferase